MSLSGLVLASRIGAGNTLGASKTGEQTARQSAEQGRCLNCPPLYAGWSGASFTSIGAHMRRVKPAPRRLEPAPDFQELVEQSGSYDKITPQAWVEWDRGMALWLARLRAGELELKG